MSSDKQRRESIKNRHRNYYWMARYLRESIECFGLKIPANNKSFQVYHGVNRFVTFSSAYSYIKGPLSTTRSYAVAQRFSVNQGMILELEINVDEWRQKTHINKMNCIDCAWISDFGAEQEVLFCGGINRFTFNTIIDVSSTIDYSKYIRGLRQMIYCTSNWNICAIRCVFP